MTSPPGALGVNIFGDWNSTTGLAQAARRLARALLRGGVELSCTSIATGAPAVDALTSRDIGARLGPPTWPVDLWTLNINEFAMLGERCDPSPGQERRRIATWYWELPTVPGWLRGQFDRVDEIWVASSFVRRAFMRYTARPIYIVPAVVPRFNRGTDRFDVRARLGVAPSAVMFLFTFDFNSSVARKNPFGVIEAFSRAFPAGDPDTVLVVKTINLAQSAQFEADLRGALQGVGGRLISEFLPERELADLFHACDVYVSLHRSEGFGLGMAEAMALGKPVIATWYSGNADFMTPGNSCPVGYQLRDVAAGDHGYQAATSGVYVEGATWAEPDVGQAARWMRLLASDEAMRRRIGREAARTMRTGFSEAAVGAIAKRRLEDC